MPLDNVPSFSRIRRSIFLAHRNSVPNMASPKGITTMAGPGRTIIAKPMSRTENPRRAMRRRRPQSNIHLSLPESRLIRAEIGGGSTEAVGG